MNNNQPPNNSDQASANSLWAELVDRYPQSEHSEDAGEANAIPQVNLSDELLDDLELDGQLRMLGTIGREDSFTDNVIAQTHPQSSSADARLPSVEPVFLCETTPVPIEGQRLESDVDDSAVVTLPVEEASEPNWSARLLAMVATVVVGCFIGSMMWPSSVPESTASRQPSNIETPNTAGSQAAYQQETPTQIELPDQAIELLPPDEGDSQQLATSDDPVQQARPKSPLPNSSAAPYSTGVQDNRDRFMGSPPNRRPKPRGIANSQPKSRSTIPDAKREIASRSGMGKPVPAAASNSNRIQAPPIASGPNGRRWNTEFDWNLAIKFDRSGMGSASLNGVRVDSIFLQDNTAFLLRKVFGELDRRLLFLENRLGFEMSGSIRIDNSIYRFKHSSEIDRVIDDVKQHLASKPIRWSIPAKWLNELRVLPFSDRDSGSPVDQLMSLRDKYRKKIFANRSRFKSINLASRDLKLYTEDEAFTICSVLSAAETILSDFASQRLHWERNMKIHSAEPEDDELVGLAAFKQFAKKGKGSLRLPDSEFLDPSIASIQKLRPSQLKDMLKDTPSVELFADLEAYQQAKNFVFSRGNPEMKSLLALEKSGQQGSASRAALGSKVDRVLAAERARAAAVERARALRANGARVPDLEPLQDIVDERSDLQGLPLVMGDECHSNSEQTRDLHRVSSSLGRLIGQFNGRLGSRDIVQNDALRNLTIKKTVHDCLKNPSEQKLKAVDQILQIDHPRLRLEIIEALRLSDDDDAIELIVNKAKFDLEPEVRIAATNALADIEPKKYRGLLLEGLKYPWHVVAEHSAEALVRLDDWESVPELIEMLDMPHPQAPVEVDGKLVQRELVAINHMKNCLLCHPPSVNSSDSVRGTIPHPNEPIPVEYYSGGSNSYAVRADVTYLEQDFSVVHRVANPGPWPSDQRFDYVVKNTELTSSKAKHMTRRFSHMPNPSRIAIIFALRELTGKTPADNSMHNWKKIMGLRN